MGTIGLRRLLSFQENTPIQNTLDKNLVPTLLKFAQDYACPKIQFESIWCLTNIASSESRFVINLVENGAINILVDVIKMSENSEVQE